MPAAVPSCTTRSSSVSESEAMFGPTIDGPLAPLPSEPWQAAHVEANCCAPSVSPLLCARAITAVPAKSNSAEKIIALARKLCLISINGLSGGPLCALHMFRCISLKFLVPGEHGSPQGEQCISA